MNKKAISIFFVTILLLAGLSTVVCSKDIKSNDEKPSFILLPSDKKEALDNFLKNHDDLTIEENKEVNSIINRIVIEDEDIKDNINIDIEELGFVIDEYDYKGVELDTSNVIDELIYLIMNMVYERLGWIYIGFEHVTSVLNGAKAVWNDRNLPKIILNEAKALINNCTELIKIFSSLMKRDWKTFFEYWKPLIIIQDFINIYDSLMTIISSIQDITLDVKMLVNSLQDFISWWQDNPFDDDIVIYGTAKKGSVGISNVEISCFGKTVKTDENGEFMFSISPNPNNKSIPPNEFYGLHLCQISANFEGENKVTPEMLSYVFSGGKIQWFFMFEDNKSKLYDKKINLIECINEKIRYLFLDLFEILKL